MRCYFSGVLVNCMHAIHFPQGTLSFPSSVRSDWGSELYGRYVSVQEPSTERVELILVIYSQPKALQERIVNPIGITFGSHQSTELEKTETVVYKFSRLLYSLLEMGIKK